VATASRLVGELVAPGFLSRDDDRRVRIGVRLWELVTRASPTLSLRDAAMPFMEGVHDVVGHHVQLGVLDGDDVLSVERNVHPDAVINSTRIAGRLPLHASSSGLVLLAHGPADLKERVLAGPLTAYTRETPVAAGQCTTVDPSGVALTEAMRNDVSGIGVATPGHPPWSGMVHGLHRTGGPLTRQPERRHGPQGGEDHQEDHRYPHLPASRVIPSRRRGGSSPQDAGPSVERPDPAQLPQGSYGFSVISSQCHADASTPDQRPPSAVGGPPG
jgi:hypothetical protein